MYNETRRLVNQTVGRRSEVPMLNESPKKPIEQVTDNPPSRLSAAGDLLRGLASVAWPLIVVALMVSLGGSLKELIESRNFKIRVGDYEISVEEYTKQQSGLVASLQDDLLDLSDRMRKLEDNAGVQAGPLVERSLTSSILWVDDRPSNNALVITQLEDLGAKVTTARSTQEALDMFRSGRFTHIITDMGRTEGGEFNPNAGLELIREIRNVGVSTSVIVYSTSTQRYAAEEIPGVVATASTTHLLTELGVR